MSENVAPWLLGMAFVAFWCSICWLLAVIGGWRALAERFGTTERAAGSIRRFQSAQVGWVNYSRCLTISLSGEGLRMAVFPIYRFGHPPLLIPWSELNNLRDKRILFASFYRVDVGSPPITTLLLRSKLVREAADMGYLSLGQRRAF